MASFFQHLDEINDDDDDGFGGYDRDGTNSKFKRKREPVPKHRYWNLNVPQTQRVVTTKFGESQNPPLSFVLLNSFVVDPRTDMVQDPEVNQHWRDEKVTIFLLGKVIGQTDNPLEDDIMAFHDATVIMRLVRKEPSEVTRTSIREGISEIKNFHKRLDSKVYDQFPDLIRPERENQYAERFMETKETYFSMFEPYIDVSTRESISDDAIADVLAHINEKLAFQQSNSKKAATRLLAGYKSITGFARLTPNVVEFASSKGLGHREYYTPRSIYGYSPDNEYDPNVFRVWLTTKELVSSIVYIFENRDFNKEYGSFRVFSDISYDAQWRFTFNIQFNQTYTTKSYRPMPKIFRKRYFGDVGSLDLDKEEANREDDQSKMTDNNNDDLPGLVDRTPLFLDVDFDAIIPAQISNKRDYSLNILHFDQETGNSIQPDTGKVLFSMPYVNMINLERIIAKKVLQDSSIQALSEAKKKLCPNCPKHWNHKACKSALPEDVERIQTQAYCKKLVSFIKKDPVLKTLYPNKPPESWIPDSKTGVDPVICICFVVGNIRDVSVSHACDVSHHYILTYRPPGDPGWNLDLDIIQGSKRLQKTVAVYFKNELDLILGFAEYIRTICPMKISGYNINGFDIPYLEYRIRWYMEFGTLDEKKRITDNPFNIGIMRYYFKPHQSRKVSRPGLGIRDMVTTFPSLLILLDVIEAVGNETFSQPTKMASHKLNAVAASSLVFPGTKEPMLKIMLEVWKGLHLWKAGGPKATNFVCYCLWDAILSFGLARHFGFDELGDVVSRVSGIQPNLTYSTGIRDKIISLYHAFNGKHGNRYLIPVEKGGLMILMHHPDIWLFSPSRCHDEPLDSDPYAPHKTCPKTKLIIPDIFEVLERRKKDTWMKGAQRNFPPNEFTPPYSESKDYMYNSKYQWLVDKSNPETNGLLPNAPPPGFIPVDFAANEQLKNKLKREIEDYTESIAQTAKALSNLRGDAAGVKYVRARLHYVMKQYNDTLRAKQKQMTTIIIDESIARGQTQGSSSFLQNNTTKNYLGDIMATPRKIAAECKKQQKKMSAEARPKKTKKSRKKAFIGGYVMNMVRGFFEEFVIFSDFNSLYPSIMFSNYIDFANLLTSYVRTEVYPNISPFSYKKVVVGPFHDTFWGDYVYDPEEAKRCGCESPELSETSWIQDPDCLTTIIMDVLLDLRNTIKREMATQTAAANRRSFELLLLSYEGKTFGSLMDRLTDPGKLIADYESFGKDWGDVKAKFIKKMSNETLDNTIIETWCCSQKVGVIKDCSTMITDHMKKLHTDMTSIMTPVSVIGPKGFHYQIIPPNGDLNQTRAQLKKALAMVITIHMNKGRNGNVQQGGVKVFMNSGYGFFGSANNLNLFEGAMTITFYGRTQNMASIVIIENMCVIKVMAMECDLGGYLITLGIHPGAFYPQLIALNPQWSPVEDYHLERAAEICTQERALGGDTDSGFVMVSGTIISPKDMHKVIYPTIVAKRPDGTLYGALNLKAKPLTGYEMVKKFANYQSLTIVQSFLPIEVIPVDKDYYHKLIKSSTMDETTLSTTKLASITKEIFMMKVGVHKNLKKIAKQRLEVEKITPFFLGFGKKRYSFLNQDTLKLFHKGSSLARGDSVIWASKLLKECLNMLFGVGVDVDVAGLSKLGSPLYYQEEPLPTQLVKIVKMFLYVIQRLEDLALGKNIDINDFVLSQRIKKDTSMYNSDPPHVRVARKMMSRGDTSVGPQSTINYVYYLHHSSSDYTRSDQPMPDVPRTPATGTKTSASKILTAKPNKKTTKLKLKKSTKVVRTAEYQSNLLDAYTGYMNKPKPITETMADLYSLDISKLNMVKDKPTELRLDSIFDLIDDPAIKQDVDTPSYVIDQGYPVNIPYYISQKIIPSLAIVLGPFICGNDEYPLVGDLVNKKKEEAIEVSQKLFSLEQQRQVKLLLWTDTLRTRVRDMLEWYKCKTLTAAGQLTFQLTSKCAQCDGYFKYPTGLGQKSKSVLLEVCPQCQSSGLTMRDVVNAKKAIMDKTEEEFITCIGKCEKCLLRGEVSIIPSGLVDHGIYVGPKRDLITRMANVGSDIEDLWELVSRIPRMRLLNQSTKPIVQLNDSSSSDAKSLISNIYPSDIWVTNPFECKYEDCKVHQRRKVLFLRHKQANQSLLNHTNLQSGF